jgi:transposase-like protein
MVISDDHAGLGKAIAEVFAEAAWQRCYVHFLRNALDYLPRKADNDCLTELRWIYDRRSIEEARQDLAAWLRKWAARYPKLCDWVEGNNEVRKLKRHTARNNPTTAVKRADNMGPPGNRRMNHNSPSTSQIGIYENHN